MKRLLCLMLIICFTLTGCRDKFQDEPPEILNERIESVGYSAIHDIKQPDDLLSKITVTFKASFRSDGVNHFDVEINNETEQQFSGTVHLRFVDKKDKWIDSATIEVKRLKAGESYLRYASCKDAPQITMSYYIEDYQFEEIEEIPIEKSDTQLTKELRKYLQENFGNPDIDWAYTSWYPQISKCEVFSTKWDGEELMLSSHAIVTTKDECTSSQASDICAAVGNYSKSSFTKITIKNTSGTELYSYQNPD